MKLELKNMITWSNLAKVGALFLTILIAWATLYYGTSIEPINKAVAAQQTQINGKADLTLMIKLGDRVDGKADKAALSAKADLSLVNKMDQQLTALVEQSSQIKEDVGVIKRLVEIMEENHEH